MALIEQKNTKNRILTAFNNLVTGILVTLNPNGTLKPFFGVWDPKAFNTMYTAVADSIIIAYSHVSGSGYYVRIEGLTDTNTPPTTTRVANASYYHAGTTTGYAGITMPVKKGHKWRVIRSGIGAPVDEAVYSLQTGH